MAILWNYVLFSYISRYNAYKKNFKDYIIVKIIYTLKLSTFQRTR